RSNRFRIKEIGKTRIKAEVKDGLAQLGPFNAQTASPQEVDQRLGEIQSVILEALQKELPESQTKPICKTRLERRLHKPPPHASPSSHRILKQPKRGSCH